MLRFVLLSVVLVMVPAAAAQSSPNNPNPPANPNNTNNPSNEEPNGTPAAAAPPTFAPSPIDSDASTASSGRVIRVSGGVMAGNRLSSVPPVYPPEAKAQHIAGVVVLSARIGKDGMVHNLQPVSGPQLLSQAAITAVQQWTYQPYMLNGKPVEVDTVITVNFNANGTS